MTHGGLDDAHLALWALGLLDAAEAADVAAHLAGCRVCAAEAEALRDVGNELALSATPQAPPPGLRDRVRDAARADRQAYRFTAAGDDGWRVVADGIYRRDLGDDATSRSRSYLIRMDAGARGGRHVHASAEHCLVLDGDFEVAGRLLHPGDFHLAAPGSVHEGNTTTGGCLLLIVEAAPLA